MQNRSTEIKRYPNVTKVKVMDDYVLKAQFENGEVKLFDCKYLLEQKFFKPLRNKGIFKKAFANLGGVVWTDMIDIAKEEVYDKGVTIKGADV